MLYCNSTPHAHLWYNLLQWMPFCVNLPDKDISEVATCGRNISGKLLFIEVCTNYWTRLYNKSIARNSITVRIALFCSLRIGNRCGNRTEMRYPSLAQQQCLQQQQSVVHPEDGGTRFFRAMGNVYQTPLCHRDFATHLCENLTARPPRTHTAICPQWQSLLSSCRTICARCKTHSALCYGCDPTGACLRTGNEFSAHLCDLQLCTQRCTSVSVTYSSVHSAAHLCDLQLCTQRCTSVSVTYSSVHSAAHL